jgi:hypothetical protein
MQAAAEANSESAFALHGKFRYSPSMKSKLLILALFSLLAGFAFAQDSESVIDFNKARALIQKERAGQTLSKEEQVYLDRAKVLRKQQQQGSPTLRSFRFCE